MTAEERKKRPVYSGVLRYFPDALMEVAYCSWVGNEQHNPGSRVHWDRSKSTDDIEALSRHLLCAGEIDSDGVRHSAKLAWRALAVLQKELEAARGSLATFASSPEKRLAQVRSQADWHDSWWRSGARRQTVPIPIDDEDDGA